MALSSAYRHNGLAPRKMGDTIRSDVEAIADPKLREDMAKKTATLLDALRLFRPNGRQMPHKQ